MATIAAALLHPRTGSRSWDARPSLNFVAPKCPVDFRELNVIKHRKILLPLARASYLKGEVDEKAEELEQKGPTINLQDAQDRQPQLDGYEKKGSDGRGHAATSVDANYTDISQLSVGEPSEDSEREDELISGDTAMKGSMVAGLLLVGIVVGLGAAGYFYREQINDFLLDFSDFIESYGAAGYAIFVAGYAGLEILAIPAIPLTMSAGLLFGTVVGTILVSISGTIAATVAFLIARYVARDRILKLAEGNKRFLAIDKAIGENSFRVVALLRLSPLLPFSLSNYLYGLTSVKLWPYVLGSWLGMLPGTWAYVSAGAVGRAFIQQEAENGPGGGPEHLVTLGVGLLVTVIAATYVTRLAKVSLNLERMPSNVQSILHAYLA